MLGLHIHHRPAPPVSAAVARNVKPCGHVHHVGTCASCQQAQQARWQVQLEQARRH